MNGKSGDKEIPAVQGSKKDTTDGATSKTAEQLKADAKAKLAKAKGMNKTAIIISVSVCFGAILVVIGVSYWSFCMKGEGQPEPEVNQQVHEEPDLEAGHGDLGHHQPEIGQVQQEIGQHQQEIGQAEQHIGQHQQE
eukprot:935408_1